MRTAVPTNQALRAESWKYPIDLQGVFNEVFEDLERWYVVGRSVDCWGNGLGKTVEDEKIVLQGFGKELEIIQETWEEDKTGDRS